MLSTGEALSAALKYSVNQGSSSVETDQKLRDRALFFLNQACKKAYSLAPWWWKLATTGSISVTSTSGTLPADFSSFGAHGNVFDANGTMLTYLEPGPFFAKRQAESSASAS